MSDVSLSKSQIYRFKVPNRKIQSPFLPLSDSQRYAPKTTRSKCGKGPACSVLTSMMVEYMCWSHYCTKFPASTLELLQNNVIQLSHIYILSTKHIHEECSSSHFKEDIKFVSELVRGIVYTDDEVSTMAVQHKFELSITVMASCVSSEVSDYRWTHRLQRVLSLDKFFVKQDSDMQIRIQIYTTIPFHSREIEIVSHGGTGWSYRKS